MMGVIVFTKLKISKQSVRRGVVGTVAGTALAVGTALAGPGTASATGSDFDGYHVNIRTAPTIFARAAGRGNRGDGLTSDISAYGSSVYCARHNNYNNVWWHIRDLRTGVVGWINSCYLIEV
jgi:hypothetical protein